MLRLPFSLEDEREYEVYVDGVSVGGMKTNVSGKLVPERGAEPGQGNRNPD